MAASGKILFTTVNSGFPLFLDVPYNWGWQYESSIGFYIRYRAIDDDKIILLLRGISRKEPYEVFLNQKPGINVKRFMPQPESLSKKTYGQNKSALALPGSRELMFLPVSFLHILLLLTAIPIAAQQRDTDLTITISGSIADSLTQEPLSGPMILNKNNHTGIFGDYMGKFTTKALKTDTIVISVVGYKTQKICFRDSTLREIYHIHIELSRLNFHLRELEINPERSLDEIEKDMDQLGIRKQYQVEGLQAVSSPVTFLYERFSRFEKQKRKAAGLYNEEMKRDLLKELFKIYIRADIIDLDETEFDDFISYCNLPENYIQQASQYELTITIKRCYESYLHNR